MRELETEKHNIKTHIEKNTFPPRLPTSKGAWSKKLTIDKQG